MFVCPLKNTLSAPTHMEWSPSGEVGVIAQAPLAVERFQHQLDGVDVPLREVLVGAEKVLEERDVLTEPRAFLKRFGSVGIIFSVHIPQLRLQGVDEMAPAHPRARGQGR